MDQFIQKAFENETELIENSLFFWKQQLDINTPPLEIPADFPRSSTPSYRIAKVSFSLSGGFGASFEQLCRQQDATIFSTLLSAYNTLLFRYTAQEDIVIGCPSIEQIFSETGELVYTLRNTKVFRTSITADARFDDLHKQVHQLVLEGNKHGVASYESLEEATKLAYGINYTGLYNVMFSFRNSGPGNNEINDWSSNFSIPENARATIDLALYIEKTSFGLTGVWTYNSELFEAATINRLSKHFEVLLEAIVSNPGQTVSQLPLLTNKERDQLTSEWNTSTTNYPTDKCIHELFEALVQKTPEAKAVVFGKKELTYGELNRRANQLAHYLCSKGVEKEMLVPICIDHSIEMMIGILGILKAGGVYVPVDPNYPTERIAYLLEDTKASIVVCNKESKIQLNTFQNIEFIELGENESIIKAQPTDNLKLDISPNNLAYIIYTSGTTGKPKGVMIEHRSVIDHCYGVIESAGLKACKSFALFSPLVFDAGHSIIHSCLILGASLHVLPKHLIINSEEVSTYFDKNSIDCMKIVPSLWLSYAGLQKIVLSKKVIIFGGEAFSLSILNYLKKANYSGNVYNHYGPTEVTIGKSIYKVNLNETYHSVPIGKPFSNTKFYVLDNDLKLVPVGIEGELYIAGDGLARGYLNQTVLTAEKFIANPFTSESSDKMYKTGDKVKWLADGNVEYLGRADEQVKIQGHRIELGEIEDALLQSELVSQAVMLALADKKGNQQLVGCIVPAKQYDQEVLMAFLRKKLPEYMIPVKCVELENLPLTRNGKINKKALETLVTTKKAFVSPSDDIEIKLASMWQELLNTEKVSVHDNFFELGGNSLHAVILFAKIKKEFHKSLPLATLFSAPTIYQLGNALKLRTETVSSSLIPIQPNGSRKPLFCVHAGHGNILFYGNLSLCLGPDQPFYGIQAKGINGTEIPFTHMEEMVNYYISEIRKVQPEGPYYLGGYCFGSRIAFEMAQQLTNQGQKVGLLASFNGISPTYGRVANPVATNVVTKKKVGKFQRVFSKASTHLKNIAKLSLKEQFLYVYKRLMMQLVGKLGGLFFLARFKVYGVIFKFYFMQKHKVPDGIARRYVTQSLDILQWKYRPKAYLGTMVVFRSPRIFTKDSSLGWKSFVKGDIKTVDIPGEHGWRRDILNEPNVRYLAKELENILVN